MRIVVALGGNALLERGQAPDAQPQVINVERAVAALAPLTADHQLIVTHGNGPQVGVLASESASDRRLHRPYPFDALVAETQGLIGYWLLQSLTNALPHQQVASLLTRVEVDPADDAFAHPTKFVGEILTADQASTAAAADGWTVAPDGSDWRRVVASPEPRAIVELSTIRILADAGVLVVCAGGGGIPIARTASGTLAGCEAVVDKDLTAALLARKIGADVLLLLTDVSAVMCDYGTPVARAMGRVTPSELRKHSFPPGSMGPKVEAACRFVEAGGAFAAIGALTDAAEIIAGHAGTRISDTTTGDLRW